MSDPIVIDGKTAEYLAVLLGQTNWAAKRGGLKPQRSSCSVTFDEIPLDQDVRLNPQASTQR